MLQYAQFRKTLISSPFCTLFYLCDMIDHHEDLNFVLYLLGQIVTWQIITLIHWIKIDHLLLKMIMMNIVVNSN